MTSLRQPGHQYATSFQVLPPCQLPEPSVAPPIPSGIQCSRHMYPCGSLKTNAALIDPGTAAVLHPSASKSNYAPVHASNSVPLHTDPEMYALRNKISDRGQENKAATFFQPQQHHHHHYPFPVVTVKRSTQVNEQAAYVEALVDTNAHVIETIWSSSSSSSAHHYSRSSNKSSAVVPLRTFIEEVLKRSRTTYSTLQTALFYLFRARPAIMRQLYENSSTSRNNCPYWQDAYISCGRRMFLASLVVASKFVQDKTYRNSAWAKIAGLPVAEINAAERIFLDLIDYRLYIAQSTFEQWHRLLHMHVEARAHNRPILTPLWQDYLLHLPTTVAAQQQLPSPVSPSSSTSSTGFPIKQQQQPEIVAHTLPGITESYQLPTTASSHHHPPFCEDQQQQLRRKRRLRDTSIGEDRRPAVFWPALSSPPSSCSPSSSMGSTAGTTATYSPPYSGSLPPVLSISLPSSSSSSPMQTPTTQVSPVRANPFTWKTGASPSHFDQGVNYYYQQQALKQQDLSSSNSSAKKRRVAECDNSSHGYNNNISHVRSMRRKQPKTRLSDA